VSALSNKDLKELAARKALDDILFLLQESGYGPGAGGEDMALSKEQFQALLHQNFAKLDPDNDGVSRQELLCALADVDQFSRDEYVMLELMAKYFAMIANLADDEPGEETRVTRTDVEVLAQFLNNSSMTLEDLYMWCTLPEGPPRGDQISPPPLTDPQ
jgi:hypothetical protein